MSLTESSPSEIAKAAAISSRSLAVLSTKARNDALTAIHHALEQSKEVILSANARDVELASKAAENGELSQSVLKRLDLCKNGKWEDMLQGILDVRDLDDPGKTGASVHAELNADAPCGRTVGKASLRTKLDDGLILERRSCPIGVLLIIFEARPEVIANITSLAIKSGNAAILKGKHRSLYVSQCPPPRTIVIAYICCHCLLGTRFKCTIVVRAEDPFALSQPRKDLE